MNFSMNNFTPKLKRTLAAAHLSSSTRLTDTHAKGWHEIGIHLHLAAPIDGNAGGDPRSHAQAEFPSD